MSDPVNAPFRRILENVRQAFPQPVSDRKHDAYVAFTVLRALDELDRRKSNLPTLGLPEPVNHGNATDARIAADPLPLEDVTAQLAEFLDGMFLWGHPRSQVNVVPPASVASVIAVLLAAIYNPNLVSEESSLRVASSEVETAAMVADLVGFDPERAAGFFTFGGTGATLYGVKLGLEKALPGSREHGITEKAVLVSSGQSHYARLSVAGWLGLGEENAIQVRTRLDNAIDLEALESCLRKLLEEGRRIACIIATAGTTDAFGIDNVGAIVEMRDRLAEEYRLDYRPHVHADAVIGWAWSVFKDYDFERNELGFRPRTVRALAKACHDLKGLDRADSIGVDFHKTGFCPYISTLFLTRDAGDLVLLTRGREKMPYLYQTGEYHPGLWTLETSRSAAGPLAAWANLKLLGKNGLRALLGHLVEMAEVLREELEGRAPTTVLNGNNVGTVTLFRVYPDGIDTFTVKERERNDPAYRDKLCEHNDYNRKIFELVHADAMAGHGVLISMTDCYRHSTYGEPINALKSYILSPFADEENVRALVDNVIAARPRVF
ncbi:pyridoxal phosphate-dependent decarboxylase family protein [Kolteria novifilia]|uniref:pyridoxal phosphate-dependent decarboxylase family protein n=1 Tax=Kolteria novifilia TaxID=2527975 RepID=UPI003AF3911D